MNVIGDFYSNLYQKVDNVSTYYVQNTINELDVDEILGITEPKKDEFWTISMGELDCRISIFDEYTSIVINKPIYLDDVIKNKSAVLMKKLEEVREHRDIGLISSPPQPFLDRKNTLNTHKIKYFPPRSIREFITMKFNNTNKKYCKETGIKYLDFWGSFKSSDCQFRKNGIYLNKVFIKKVVENYLISENIIGGVP